MHFQGESDVKASREQLWEFLMSSKDISGCIPGIQQFETIDKDNFKATVKVGLGVIRTTFNFKFTFASVNAPLHSELKGKGSGSLGVIDFNAIMDLVSLDNKNTKLSWAADVELLGPLAGMASRFMKSAATDITKDLFGCIKAKVET